MTFREQLSADSAAVFLNTSEFAESVTYKPHRYDGESARDDRPISAVVVRESISAFEDDVQTALPHFEVYVDNDSTTGISSDEIDPGSDRLSFPTRDGETASDHQIIELIRQDSAMLVLLCR